MLCFKGRCYPSGETASSVDKGRARQNFFNEDQKADLKKKMIDRYVRQYGKEKSDQIQSEIESFFRSGADVNSTSLYVLENRLKKQYGEVKLESKGKAKGAVSQMESPVSLDPVLLPTPESTRRGEVAESQMVAIQADTGSMPHLVRSDADFRLPSVGGLTKNQVMDMQTIQWKNDEEKWGTIYKYNAYVYKQEQRLEKLRAMKKMQAVRNTLEEQVREKERDHQKEREQQVSFITLNNQLKSIEMMNDNTRKEHVKAKVEYQREMRQRQMEENRVKREREELAEKLRQEMAIKKIKEELMQEKQENDDLKQRKLEEMRRVMGENEERKIIMAHQREKERIEDIALQRKAVEISEELERQRQAEFKAKGDRLTEILKR